MLAHPVAIWFIAGILLLVIDKLQNKITLLYAAYAAFTVAIFLVLGIMKVPTPDAPDYPYYSAYIVGQGIVFGIGCMIWGFVLRDATPKSNPKNKELYQDIVGKIVEVSTGGINAVSGGEVLLNGKILRAKLAANSEQPSIKAGTKMQVDEVIGDTLVVSPYND